METETMFTREQVADLLDMVAQIVVHAPSKQEALDAIRETRESLKDV